MQADALNTWIDSRGPDGSPLLLRRLLSPPYGYVLGIALWPGYLAVLYASLFVTEILELLPFAVSAVVFLSGLLVTSALSILVMGSTAWRVSTDRIRDQFFRTAVLLLLAPALFVVYTVSISGLPSPYAVIAPLGLDAFVDHAIITTVLLGPVVGFALLVFPLVVLVYRSRLE